MWPMGLLFIILERCKFLIANFFDKVLKKFQNYSRCIWEVMKHPFQIQRRREKKCAVELLSIQLFKMNQNICPPYWTTADTA